MCDEGLGLRSELDINFRIAVGQLVLLIVPVSFTSDEFQLSTTLSYFLQQPLKKHKFQKPTGHVEVQNCMNLASVLEKLCCLRQPFAPLHNMVKN